MSDNEKTLIDAYYWLSMYNSGAITEGVAVEQLKVAIFDDKVRQFEKEVLE